jgi:hypothetical protein
MRAIPKNKKVVAIVAAGLLIATAGGAYAYWTTTGSGTGNATNASSNGTVVLHATFAPGLTPGASESVTYTADNGGTSNLFVGTISSLVSVDAAHSTCLITDFTVPNVTSNMVVPAGASVLPVGTGSISFANTGANQDGCKSAIVTLTVSSS